MRRLGGRRIPPPRLPRLPWRHCGAVAASTAGTEHPALGVALRPALELPWPRGDADAQASLARRLRRRCVAPRAPAPSGGGAARHRWDLTRPFVLRGFARDWDYVREGRLDPGTEEAWRRELEQQDCVVEFGPGGDHYMYREVSGMDPGLRLVNPGQLLFKFPDFLDACHVKRHGAEPSDIRRAAALENPVRSVMAANLSYEDVGPSLEDLDSKYLPMFPRPQIFDLEAGANSFSLYCAQHSVSRWPQRLLDTVAPFDPAERLLPDWTCSPITVNAWMCGGGPSDRPVTSNFHADYSENFHVVLSGRKEVFLCHPSDAAVLRGTSYTAQAAWSLADDWPVQGCVGKLSGEELPEGVQLQEVFRTELCTPHCMVHVDASFEDNCKRSPLLRSAALQRRTELAMASDEGGGCRGEVPGEGREAELTSADSTAVAWHCSGPLRAELFAGDLVYIPAGWFHAVRTWRPLPEERGLPFSLGVNFWRACCEELEEKERLFRFLDLQSIRQAQAGNRKELMEAYLSRLRAASSCRPPDSALEQESAGDVFV